MSSDNNKQIEIMTTENIEWKLALGRILSMGSRPAQQGDVEEFYRCVDIIMDYAEKTGIEPPKGMGYYKQGTNFGQQICAE